ncbi:MAG: hypothetical protein ACFFF4_12300 [Candidatus Thorarchaeota archaeon]
MSTAEYQPCWICVEQEVAKLISLSIDLGIEPKTRDDVRNMIRMCDFSSINEDPIFTENVIDAYLTAA